MPKKKLIKVYFDIGSPYSYTALELLRQYSSTIWADHIQIQLEPVLLGAIHKATGNQPPLAIPHKASYLLEDMIRSADWVGINMKLSDEFPLSSLKAMRILTATKRLFPDKLWDVSFAFFETYFVYCNNITDQSCLLSAIKKTTLSQSSINDILTLSETQNIKDALKIATSDAINIGIFGCPTFAVLRDQINKDKLRVFTKKKCLNQYEIFFGADRLHLLAYYLNLPFFGPFQNSHNQSNEAKL